MAVRSEGLSDLVATGGNAVAFGTPLAILDGTHDHNAQIAARTLRGATVGNSRPDGQNGAHGTIEAAAGGDSTARRLV